MSRAIREASAAIFFPRPDLPFGPAAPGARDHLFDTGGGIRLRIRLFLGDPAAPAILFFHGNGETARDYDPLAAAFGALPASLLAAEYRGYGPGTGEPGLDSFLLDAHAELDEARSLLAGAGHRGPLVAMGRSLGSAPAIELASARPGEIGALIVESGFARIAPLLERIGVPARALGMTEEEGPQNESKMAGIAMPTLILHAEEDEIIPIAEAERLHAACRDPDKRLLRVPGAGHNDIQMRAGRRYFDAIAELLGRL